MRIDLALVQKKIVDSREKAQALIEQGVVQYLGKIVSKASLAVDLEKLDQIIVLDSSITKFVSRAGLKLDSALAELNFEVSGLSVLDIGQSTGGFSDCVLQRGALKVVGIDVGHKQLHEKLKQNPDCVFIEGVNARDLIIESTKFKELKAVQFDLVVMDVSFISISLIISQVLPFLKSNGFYLFLVKPQFEGAPENLDQNGIVDLKKFPNFYYQVEEKMRKLCSDNIGPVTHYFESKLEGKDGNKEFFIFGRAGRRDAAVFVSNNEKN